MARSVLLRMTSRGSVTLPKEVRAGFDADTVFEVVRREDDTIELRPRAMVPTAQKWYWTERWQQMERAADADVAAGRVERFGDAEAFLDRLDEAGADTPDPASSRKVGR